MPEGIQLSGRRIYVHEETFADLARQSPEAADLVFGMLGRVSAVKITHHVMDDSAGLGELSARIASDTVDAIERAWGGQITKALQAIWVRPARGRVAAPLLDSSERITATCYFSNYYTFATDEASAREMFLDTTEIGAIRTQQAGSGANDRLILLSGRCLSIGPPRARQKPMDRTVTDARRRMVFSAIKSEFRDVMSTGALAGSPQHLTILIRLSDFLEIVLRRGVLKESFSHAEPDL